jgi:hypothetical protein
MKNRMFKKSMLEYCKIIMAKMKFNRRLFRKEYRKTFHYLEPTERVELKQWLRQMDVERMPLVTDQNKIERIRRTG